MNLFNLFRDREFRKELITAITVTLLTILLVVFFETIVAQTSSSYIRGLTPEIALQVSDVVVESSNSHQVEGLTANMATEVSKVVVEQSADTDIGGLTPSMGEQISKYIMANREEVEGLTPELAGQISGMLEGLARESYSQQVDLAPDIALDIASVQFDLILVAIGLICGAYFSSRISNLAVPVAYTLIAGFTILFILFILPLPLHPPTYSAISLGDRLTIFATDLIGASTIIVYVIHSYFGRIEPEETSEQQTATNELGRSANG